MRVVSRVDVIRGGCRGARVVRRLPQRRTDGSSGAPARMTSPRRAGSGAVDQPAAEQRAVLLEEGVQGQGYVDRPGPSVIRGCVPATSRGTNVQVSSSATALGDQVVQQVRAALGEDAGPAPVRPARARSSARSTRCEPSTSTCSVAEQLAGLVEVLGVGAGRHQHLPRRGAAQPLGHLGAPADQHDRAAGPGRTPRPARSRRPPRSRRPAAQGVEDPLVGGVVDRAAAARSRRWPTRPRCSPC